MGEVIQLRAKAALADVISIADVLRDRGVVIPTDDEPTPA